MSQKAADSSAKSSLMAILNGTLGVLQYSAASFIETISSSSLTMDADEFVARMMAAGIPDMQLLPASAAQDDAGKRKIQICHRRKVLIHSATSVNEVKTLIYNARSAIS